MSNVFSRRNAFLGWAVWTLAKRRLRKRLRADGKAPRRRLLRGATAVAALAVLAAVWAKALRRGAGDG